jgi:hypothetical protein
MTQGTQKKTNSVDNKKKKSFKKNLELVSLKSEKKILHT